MINRRLLAVFILVFVGALGYFVYVSESPGTFWHRPFKLGLDLRGGSHLVFEADTKSLSAADIGPAMSALREVVDRRVNAYGVTEPVIQTEKVGLGDSALHRLIVELPGVTDPEKAAEMIQALPLLEFRLVQGQGENMTFVPSRLTGRFLKRAVVQSASGGGLGVAITLAFNDEGAKIFAQMTKENIGLPIGIFLDGQLLSAPVVREEIRDGRAEITGNFNVKEAQALARNLNYGALPVAVKLISTETVGATLGNEALDHGIRAGVFGFIVVVLFMIVWYRLPGVMAVVSLSIYIILMLAIFKLLPVTLTTAAIAGFILSVGMAVDANILIFERTKEELRRGASLPQAIDQGFSRAWLSIRDSNLSTIISSVILFWFATSFIKGFALTLAIGVIVSMLTAITITRTFFISIGISRTNAFTKFLFSSGFNLKPKT